MKRMTLFAVLLAMTVGLAGAQDQAQEQTQLQSSDLKITLDQTFTSKYMYRGIDFYNDRAAYQPSLTFDFGDTGFSATLWYSMCTGNNNSLYEELRYALAYQNSLFAGDTNQIDYKVGYIYHDFINFNNTPSWLRRKSTNMNFYEGSLDMSMPNICPLGIVPHYELAYVSNAKSGGFNRDMNGFMHTFGLTYDFDAGCYIPNKDQQIVTLTWDIAYNDGIGYDTIGDHEWAYMTFGASTPFEVGPGTLTTGVYYQKNLDTGFDTVNDGSDDAYASMTYSLSF